MIEQTRSQQPLSGLLVLDVSVTLPGPYASSLLHRLGARVVKFEPPAGDVTRMFPLLHAAVNRGKESVTVDLKNPADQDLVRTMARGGAAFIEGWRPGVAARLGLGYEDLRAVNPALVYCSISGYGASSAMRDRPGHDLNYVAGSGMAKALFGDRPPHGLGIPLADLAGGTFAALRILAAVVDSQRTGRGTFIDVSLAGAVRDWVEAVAADDGGDALGSLADLPHYDVFETADGQHLTLGTVYEDHFWTALCDALSIASFKDLGFVERAGRAAEIREVIRHVIGSRTRAELETALAEADTCWAFVETPGAAPEIGGMVPRARGEVPSLGEHTDPVRAEAIRAATPQEAP